MFDIKVGGISLDFTPGTSLTVTMVNPAFDEESIERIYSYPVDLPLTPRNRAALDHADRLDNREDVAEYSADFYLGGVLFDRGTLVVTDVDNTTIEAHFENKGRNILETWGDMNLRDILGTVDIPQTNLATYYIEVYDTRPLVSVDYIVTIDGETFTFTTTGAEDPSTIAGELRDLINAEYPGMATVGPSTLILTNNTSKTLQVLLNVNMDFTSYVSDAEARGLNYKDWAEDVVQNGDDRLTLPVLNNPDLYGEKNPIYKDHANHYRGIFHTENTPQNTGDEWEQTAIPCVKLTHIITEILSRSGITHLVSDWYEETDTQELILYNVTTLDEVTSYLDQNGAGPFYLNHFKQSFDLGDHVPDITVREFMAATLELFAQYARLDDQRLEIRPKNEALQGDPLDWTGKAETRHSFTKGSADGFTLDYMRDDGDIYDRVDQLEPYVHGDGGQLVQTVAFTVHETNLNYYGLYTWRVPRSQQVGNSEPLDLKDNDAPLRFLYYRGLAPDSGAGQYPLATHGVKDYLGNTVGARSMDWNGDPGLYLDFWRYYIDTIDKKAVTKYVCLGVDDILNLKGWSNARARIFHPMGEMTGAIESVEFRITREMMEVATVTFRGLI